MKKTKKQQVAVLSLSFLFIAMFAVFILQSCGMNEIDNQSTSNSQLRNILQSTTVDQYDYLDLPNVYQHLGLFHNEGLDSVYSELSNAFDSVKQAKSISMKATIRNSSQAIDCYAVSYQAIQKYVKSNKIFPMGKSNIELASYANKSLKFKAVSSDLSSDLPNLSAKQIVFMNKIHSVVDSAFKMPKDIFKSKLAAINREAEQSLSSEEIVCIYSATSVAYSSYQYWTKNIYKWAYIFVSNNACDNAYGKCLSSIYANKTKNKRLKYVGVCIEGADGILVDVNSLPTYTINGHQVTTAELITQTVNDDAQAAAGELLTIGLYSLAGGPVVATATWSGIGAVAIGGSATSAIFRLVGWN